TPAAAETQAKLWGAAMDRLGAMSGTDAFSLYQRYMGGIEAGTNAAEPSMTMDQPAYHGTPHNVDRFSLQKIGTGEGAQVYGWGLYFANKREVAESYQRDLAGDGYRTASGGVFKPDTLDHLSIRVAAR